MADRRRLIMNHSGYLPAMRRAMEARGIVLDDDVWQPSPDRLAETLACHVWFYDVIRHPWRIYRLARILRRHNVPLIAWNRDAPHYLNFDIPRRRWRLDLADRLRLLDIYATHTLIDHRQFADEVLYLPNAADTDTYGPGESLETLFPRLRQDDNYRYDVSFFGGMNGRRYKEDTEREQFFAALSERLAGLGLRVLFREGDGLSVEDQIELIQTSRINLNFGARCEYGANVASGLPERCYGIPACGGFLLCDRRTHARDDFTIGENWAEFDGLDDCVARIRDWLSHFGAARDLAERCHHHVMARHTYHNRAETLHATLLAWHERHERSAS